ncbi:MAG TPA: hypothetical protein VNX28_03450 [Gemmataceae bacterium]|jgi:hypothetical protein|nr:hypothetical protein [Gemmataceae bacterium]
MTKRQLKPFHAHHDLSSAMMHWQFGDNSDRSIAIIGGSIVENCLEGYIASRMPKGKVSENLLQHVLDSFGKMIDAAYAFMLIPEDLRQELDLIRKIRNSFAHKIFADYESEKTLEGLRFENREIKGWCSTLKSCGNAADSRDRFIGSVSFTSRILVAESKVPWDRKAPKSLSISSADMAGLPRPIV